LYDIHGAVGGDSVLRYDATSLDNQSLGISKECSDYIFKGVKFFSDL
jgi:hypothetical protein